MKPNSYCFIVVFLLLAPQLALAFAKSRADIKDELAQGHTPTLEELRIGQEWRCIEYPAVKIDGTYANEREIIIKFIAPNKNEIVETIKTAGGEFRMDFYYGFNKGDLKFPHADDEDRSLIFEVFVRATSDGSKLIFENTYPDKHPVFSKFEIAYGQGSIEYIPASFRNYWKVHTYRLCRG